MDKYFNTFLHLFKQIQHPNIYGDEAEGGYENTIKAIKQEAHEIHDELTKENIFEKFQDAFQEKAFGKIIEIGGQVAKKAVMHKLGLD